MYIVTYHFNNDSLKKNTFDSYEDALAEAEDKASKDYDECTFSVSELKSVVKAEPVRHPVKTATISDREDLKLLIEQDGDEETPKQYGLQD